MTAADLGLGGNPIKYLGAFVKSVNANLGLTQSPGTCNMAALITPSAATSTRNIQMRLVPS